MSNYELGRIDSEIARLRQELADAREVLNGMDDIVARLRSEKAELVEALEDVQKLCEDFCISWERRHRSATEKGEPT